MGPDSARTRSAKRAKERANMPIDRALRRRLVSAASAGTGEGQQQASQAECGICLQTQSAGLFRSASASRTILRSPATKGLRPRCCDPHQANMEAGMIRVRDLFESHLTVVDLVPKG